MRDAARNMLALEPDLAPQNLAILRNIANWQIPPVEIMEAGRKVVRFRRAGSYQDLTNAIGELEDVIENGEE